MAVLTYAGQQSNLVLQAIRRTTFGLLPRLAQPGKASPASPWLVPGHQQSIFPFYAWFLVDFCGVADRLGSGWLGKWHWCCRNCSDAKLGASWGCKVPVLGKGVCALGWCRRLGLDALIRAQTPAPLPRATGLGGGGGPALCTDNFC